MKMNIKWQHWALFLGAPAAMAFLDCVVNSQAPMSRATLSHAAMAAAMVAVALAKQSFVVPPPAPPGAS